LTPIFKINHLYLQNKVHIYFENLIFFNIFVFVSQNKSRRMKRNLLPIALLSIFFVNIAFGQTFNSSGPVTIPVKSFASSIIPVTGIGLIGPTFCKKIDKVNLTIDCEHAGDLLIFLISPNGDILELSSIHGGIGNKYINTTFIDSGSNFPNNPQPNQTYKPDGRRTTLAPPIAPISGIAQGTHSFASTFKNFNADGDWKLYVYDFFGDTGLNYIVSWSITFKDNAASTSGTILPVKNICLGIGSTLQAGSGSAYSWSTGETTQSIFVNPSVPTNYTVTVTTLQGCTLISITPVIPVPFFSLPAQASGGCKDEDLTLNAPPGATYQWSNGASTPSIVTNQSANTSYTVTTTDATGCKSVKTFNVDILDIAASLTENLYMCTGSQVSLFAPLNPNYTYLWFSGQTYSSLNVNPTVTTTYELAITTGFCTKIKLYTVNVTPEPSANAGSDVVNCGAKATTLTAAGGGTYKWSNGQNTQSINVTPFFTTTYTVTVTDAVTGCTKTDDVKVTVVPLPNFSLGLDKKICSGKSTTLTASGGTSYIWSDGSTSQTLNVNPTTNTTYMVTVTNAAGCTATDDILVTVNPNPTALASPNVSICAGQSTTLTASGGNSYTWSSGGSGSTVSVSPNSTTAYTVVATDGNLCTASAQVIVTVNLVNVNAGNDVTICNGQNVVLDANSSNLGTYAWDNGILTNTNTVSPTTNTTYTVTFTDTNNGCTKTDDVLVKVVAPPIATANADVTICNGGLAFLNASGGTSYAWNNGSTSPAPSVSPNSTTLYTVSVSNGTCAATDDVWVTVIPLPIALISGKTQLCSGETTLSANSGFPIYTWSNGASTKDITVTQAGTYNVIVTDANGCAGSTQTFIISEPQPTISGVSTICPNSNGVLQVNQNYDTYEWNNGKNGKSITISQSGNYTVTTTDFSGCKTTANYTVLQGAAPSVSIVGTTAICTNGSTLLTVNSPNAAAYKWSNNSTWNILSISQAGDYTVTVTNLQGCTAEKSVTVTQYPNPTVSINGPAQICETGGSAQLSVNGNFSKYAWSNSFNNPNITVNTSGNYSVTVTDANGCEASNQIFISPKKVVANITGSTSFCPGKSTLLTASATNASSYLWSNGVTTASASINAIGKATVTITDNIGCKGVANVDVTTSSSLQPKITGTTQICEGNETTFDVGNGFLTYEWSDGSKNATLKASKSGVYTVSVSDGVCTGAATVNLDVVKNDINIKFVGDTLICPNATTTLEVNNIFNTYQWSNINGSNKVDNISVGKYSVTVTNLVGCKSTKNIEVKTSPNPTPTIVGNLNFCVGLSTTLKTGQYENYIWNTGKTDSEITVNIPEQYSVTVTDKEGCKGSTFVNVTQSIGLLPKIQGKNTICEGETLTIQTDNYATYLWSDGTNKDKITVSKAGIYTVSVTDNTGCNGENTLTITEKKIPKPAIVGDTLFCEGLNKTLTINGLYPYSSYQWNDGSANKSVTTTKTGKYSLKVTDGSCQDSASVFINVVKNNLSAKILGDSVVCVGKSTFLSNQDKNIVLYEWKNTSGTIKNQDTLTTKGSTTWQLNLTDIYGCTASKSLKIVEIPLPKTTIKGDSIILNATPTILDAGAGFTTYLWNNGVKTQSVTITQSGTYTVTVTNTNGCSSTASFVCKALNFIKPDILGKDKICLSEATKLTLNQSFDTYLWSDGNTTSSISVTKGGLYYVTVTKNGLTGKDTFEVVQSNLKPVISTKDYNGFGVSCLGKSDGQLSIENLSGAKFPIAILWSNNEKTQSITNLKSGIYDVKIKDAFGCEWSSSKEIKEPSQMAFGIKSTAPNCKNSNSGEVVLENLENVFSPYQVFSNNQKVTTAFTQKLSLKNFSEGKYSIKIVDNNGCELEKTIEVAQQIIPKVTLPDDVTIFVGDELPILAQSNILPTKIFWSDTKQLSCSDCLNPIAKPSESTDYTIIVTDKFGCEAKDVMEVYLNKDIYVPTAFSPNGDNNNDYFTIYSNRSVEKIEIFLIYDQWGTIVFNGSENIKGWDGTYRNTECQNGVYIYFAEIMYKNGSKKLVKGDVLLQR
jgi:trimeric autotransporter adhesin